MELDPQLKKKSEARWKEHVQWEALWQEITTLVRPSRSDIIQRNSPGQSKTSRLYDTTAVEAAERLAAALGSLVTSAVLPWVEYDIPTLPGFPRTRAMDDWLQAAREKVLRTLAQSNFYRAMGECYGDLTTVAICAMFIDERLDRQGRFDGFNFNALHLNEYAISEDDQETVDAVDIKICKPLQDWAEEVGVENLHETHRLKLRDKPLEELELIQMVFQRHGRRVGLVADRFPVASLLVDMQNNHVVQEKGYHEWPLPVGRWHKANRKETYARGPAYTALPDIQTLNKADEYGIKSWAQALRPPLMVLHDGVIGAADTRPDHINYINQEGAMQYLVSGERLDVTQVRREDKRDAIRRIFFMDQVQFIPERGKTPPTAAEINARLQIMLQIMGPTLVGFEYDFQTVAADRVFMGLMRNGQIPPPPPELVVAAQANNGKLDVKFIGPISRARKQADVQSLDESTNYILSVAQAVPDVLDIPDWDEAVRRRALWQGIPSDLMKSRDRVQEIRAAKAQQMQAAQAQQEQAMDAEAIQKVGSVAQ